MSTPCRGVVTTQLRHNENFCSPSESESTPCLETQKQRMLQYTFIQTMIQTCGGRHNFDIVVADFSPIARVRALNSFLSCLGCSEEHRIQ